MVFPRCPPTRASYTPRIGLPPPPAMPIRISVFALPDASTMLADGSRVAMICLANLALGFGLGYAFAAYRRPLERLDGEDPPVLSARTVELVSDVVSRAVAPETATELEPATNSENIDTAGRVDSKIRVSQLFIYPIKACAGVPVESALVTQRGLENDRLFMVIDFTRRSVTQKKHPRLSLVRPSFDSEGRLCLEAPGMEPFVHEVKKWGTKQSVTHLTATCDAIDQGDEVAEFFVKFLGVQNLRLVRMREGFVRKVENKHVKPGMFQTSFSDSYPFLLASKASLSDMSEKTGRELEITRFRPNIVVEGEGLKPFEEDAWKQLAVGERAEFEVPTSCIRCKVVTVDPATGVMDEHNQPTETLKKYRSFGKTVVFGQNLVPIHRRRGAEIKVGDGVIVTETLDDVPLPDSTATETKAEVPGESSRTDS